MAVVGTRFPHVSDWSFASRGATASVYNKTVVAADVARCEGALPPVYADECKPTVSPTTNPASFVDDASKQFVFLSVDNVALLALPPPNADADADVVSCEDKRKPGMWEKRRGNFGSTDNTAPAFGYYCFYDTDVDRKHQLVARELVAKAARKKNNLLGGK
jgi:hypothetical protein